MSKGEITTNTHKSKREKGQFNAYLSLFLIYVRYE